MFLILMLIHQYLYVVCYKIRGNRDLVKNEVNGYLVEVGNVNKYVKSVYKIMQKQRNLKY